MYIDLHGHVRRLKGSGRFGYDNFPTPEELLRRHDELGIHRCVLLPLVSCEVYEPQSNYEILSICHDWPDRFIPFCNVDPRAMSNTPDAPLAELLAFYKEQGFKGLGEITAHLPFNDPMVDNLFRACQAVGFSVTFDGAPVLGEGYGLYDEPGLPYLERALDRFPSLTFIGHGPPFWAEIAVLETPWSRAGYPKGPVRQEGVVPKLMRRCPNLHADLSAGSGYNAISRDPEYGPAFLEEFQDRLYFGSDICAPEGAVPQAAYLVRLRDERQITPTCFEKIAWRNAERLLGLG